MAKKRTPIATNNAEARAVMAEFRRLEQLDDLAKQLNDLHLEQGISFGDMARKLRAAQLIQIELARMAIARERKA